MVEPSRGLFGKNLSIPGAGPQKSSRPVDPNGKKKNRRWPKIVLGVFVFLLIVGGVVFWKAGATLRKISPNGGIFSSLVKSLPGANSQLKGEADGRINILLLGMRGENVPGGGTLADTIMVLSLHLAKDKDANDTNRASLVSIPRDLYVTVPSGAEKRKINAVYALGHERAGQEGAIKDMETIVSQVTGQSIQYAVVINFQGFIDLVNAVGGIDISLEQPFSESQQFHEAQVCDPYVYTVPTSPMQYQNKYDTTPTGRKRVVKSYPLCYNKSEECGGNFTLPAGNSHLDGSKALCYARSRYTSNDFERAKRQQQVIDLVKVKALSAGTLGDFSKVNGIFDSLGNNVRTDMEGWEMKHLFDLYQKGFSTTRLTQKVLDNTEEGLLYDPPMTPETGYILLPRGDTYDRIRALFAKLP